MARTTEDRFFDFVRGVLAKPVGDDGGVSHITDVLQGPRFPGLETRPSDPVEPLPDMPLTSLAGDAEPQPGVGAPVPESGTPDLVSAFPGDALDDPRRMG